MSVLVSFALLYTEDDNIFWDCCSVVQTCNSGCDGEVDAHAHAAGQATNQNGTSPPITQLKKV